MEILDQNLLLKKSKEGFDELYHNSIQWWNQKTITVWANLKYKNQS